MKIAFESDNPLSEMTFTWEDIKHKDGLYEIDPALNFHSTWPIFISNGFGEVFVTAKDGKCIIQYVTSGKWENLRFVKSNGRLVISN